MQRKAVVLRGAETLKQIRFLGNLVDQKAARSFGIPHPNGRISGVIEGERLHVSSVEWKTHDTKTH